MRNSTNSQRRTGHSGRKRQCQLHSRCHLLTDTPSDISEAETETTGPQTPQQPTKLRRDTSPHQLSCILCMQAGPTQGRDRTSIAELLADQRCSQAVLTFLATTDVGRTSGPPVADENEDAASEAC